MKKILICLICLFSLSLGNVYADEIEKPEVTDHEKVTIYLFRGKGCSHCYDALNYFNEVASEYKDYFEIKTYEIWYNQENKALLDDYLALKGETFDGVPYIAIGEEYTEVGFGDSLADGIITAALQEYENKNYVDAVAKVAENHPDAQMTTLKEACIEEEIIVEKRDTSNDVYIIIGIFAVVVLGGGALVFFSRKK